MNKEIVKVEGIYKKYKGRNNYANEDINLSIYENQIYGFLGPNGAGKTTLVRQISGLLKPTKGRILIDGTDVLNNPIIIPNYISYFGQQMFALDSHKVWESIYYTGIYRGMSKENALKQTNMLISLFEMQDVRDKLMSTISGGQKKLVGLLVVLIGFNPIIILDEPTNDLDPINRMKLWNTLVYLKNNFKLTIIVVTHNILEAEKIVDQVVIIDKGKILGMGSPQELKDKISKNVRIEIDLNDLDMLDKFKDTDNFLKVEKLKSNIVRITVAKEDAVNTLNIILSKIDYSQIKDMKIVTPSLEDVYISLGGDKSGIK